MNSALVYLDRVRDVMLLVYTVDMASSWGVWVILCFLLTIKNASNVFKEQWVPMPLWWTAIQNTLSNTIENTKQDISR